MKKILLLGAGHYYKNVISKLIEGGYYVIAVDKDSTAEGQKIAHEFFPIDIIDKESILALALDKKINGIMNLNEFGSRSASYVADIMRLNGHSSDTIEATNDKGIMRDKWQLYALSIPKYRVFEQFEELNKHIRLIGFPAVLKPADSGGSGRGISIIHSTNELLWAFEFAKKFARNSRFIVEEFIEGIELTVETFTIDKKHYFLAMSDKVKPPLKTCVATSLNYPAMIYNEVRASVEKLVTGALDALGIKNGIAHTEVIVNQDGIPFLVETGARGGGGHIFHTIIEIVSGINAPILLAKWLTNEEVKIEDIQENGCCYRFFNPPHGILKSIENIDKARNIKGVCDLAFVKKPGDVVGNLENSLERAGYVVTKGVDRLKAIETADEVESLLNFNIILNE